MSLFDQPQITKSEAIAAFARTAKLQAADTLSICVSRYNMQYDHVWHNAVCETAADAQALLDSLGPGAAAEAFQASYALGVMINTVAPGTIPAERLAPPMAYSVEVTNGVPRIVLDPEGVYPGPVASGN